MSSARQIDVNPTGDGNYAIVVDGLLWCYAFREAHGMHGASYRIQHSRDAEPIKQRGSEVVVWSDKHWLRDQGFSGRPDTARRQAKFAGKYRTLQERIAETVSRLIKNRRIISPVERAKQAEARAELSRKKREEFEAASRRRLEVEARKAVREMRLPDCGASVNDRFVARIVEAMEWARSNT